MKLELDDMREEEVKTAMQNYVNAYFTVDGTVYWEDVGFRCGWFLKPANGNRIWLGTDEYEAIDTLADQIDKDVYEAIAWIERDAYLCARAPSNTDDIRVALQRCVDAYFANKATVLGPSNSNMGFGWFVQRADNGENAWMGRGFHDSIVRIAEACNIEIHTAVTTALDNRKHIATDTLSHP